MNPMPQDTGADQPWLLPALAALLAVIIAWAKKADPRLILVWMNEPLMRKHLDPVRADIAHIKGVIDHMPGAAKAKAAAKAEKESW